MRPPLRTPLDRREGEIVDAVGEAVEAMGLPLEGIGILRRGTSLLVGLPAADALVRVDRPALAARAARQVEVARLMEACSVPAVRTLDAEVHELPVPNAPVMSIWRWEVVAERVATPAEVGSLAGHLHRSTVGAPGLDDLAPTDPLAASLEQLGVGSPDDHRGDADLLTEVAGQLRSVWEEISEAEPTVLVHADLHPGNVIVTADGPLLADLELAGPGPAAYDLVPQVVAERRYGSPASETSDLLAAYGSELPDAADVEALVPVYELWVTAWSVSNRGLDAPHEAEAQLRMRRWRNPLDESDQAPLWTLR